MANILSGKEVTNHEVLVILMEFPNVLFVLFTVYVFFTFQLQIVYDKLENKTLTF